MNLSELRNLVRTEAMIEGLREYDSLIDSILNQELSALTGKSKYEELLAEQVYTSPLDGTYLYTLPSDFQLFGSVNYQRPGSDPDFTLHLSKGSKNLWDTQQQGYPQYYRRVGSNLWIFPYTDFLLGEIITLSYYKKQILILDTDTLLVPALEKTLIQFTMGRMLSMTDTKRAILSKQEAVKSWQDVRAENAGN